MNIKHLLCLGGLLVSCLPVTAGFLDKEIAFSEAEVQAALAKNAPMEKSYGGVLTVSQSQTPQITLGTPSGQATLLTQAVVTLVGYAPAPVEMQATAGIRYEESTKSFYLENPVVHSLSSPSLIKEAQAPARRAMTSLLSAYLKNKPVYVLREDGSSQERTARWLLKSVRIEPGRVVATLSPF